MDAKRVLTNGVFCPMPWVGLMYNFDGTVKNCIRSAGSIGRIQDESIDQILTGATNQDTQARMLQDNPGQKCYPCYDLENNKKDLEIISDRVFYIREMKQVPLSTYRQGNHELRTVDLRWSNLCNFACVYCSSTFSSRWAQELKIKIDAPSDQQIKQLKDYVFDRIADLKHVYLAGGEPLLMKENVELLQLLKEKNPNVNLRINTNLSCMDTRVFDLICEFEHVHWTISVESMGEQFDYIRFGGRWDDFLRNLEIIRRLPHKISFNMLHFLLNHRSLFDCIDFLLDLDFHPNCFVVGALLQPTYLNIRHLPKNVLDSVIRTLQDRLATQPGYLLQDSYRNLMHYIQQPFDADLQHALAQIQILDQRRNLDSKKIFPDLYTILKEP